MTKSVLLRITAAALVGLAGAGLAEPSFVPVYQNNFPDPFVMMADGGFIAYSTNDGLNLPMATSKDLVHWSPVMDPANPAKRLEEIGIARIAARNPHPNALLEQIFADVAADEAVAPENRDKLFVALDHGGGAIAPPFLH